MASRPEFPAQALPVLAALYEQPTQWQDGSALAMQTGLPPERMHPILSQLAACGLAQIARPGETQPGQPAGKRYRLTAEGLASAAIALAAAAQPAGTSTLRVRYPDGHGILRRVLNEATQRGFVIDDLATEPVSERSHGSAAQQEDDGPAIVAVTMHVHGRRPVSELASALTDLDLVDAVVAASQPADD